MPFVDVKKIPSTGNELIDEGHRHLAEVINQVYEAWLRNDPHDKLCDGIDDITKALEDHFSTEIAVVRAAGFTKWQDHMVVHDKLRAKIKNKLQVLKETCDFNDASIDLFETLDGLIYEHEILDDGDFWAVFGPQGQRPKRETVLTWKDAYQVDVPELDRQHRALCEILNQIHEVAISEAFDRDGARSLIEQFQRQARQHFMAEDTYLRDMMGEAAESHAHDHADLLSELETQLDDLDEALAGDLPNFVEGYLAPWLMDHMCVGDRKAFGLTPAH
ncbi:Conserved protein of unknown function, contains hemerythrin domain [Magnetospira sp. QH-2]|nr:Conserved protein of unknown function, contains hemerythrin domain [Magnetospira sp. QH-2]